MDKDWRSDALKSLVNHLRENFDLSRLRISGLEDEFTDNIGLGSWEPNEFDAFIGPRQLGVGYVSLNNYTLGNTSLVPIHMSEVHERMADRSSWELPVQERDAIRDEVDIRTLRSQMSALETRHRFLISLVGEEALSEQLEEYCTYSPERQTWYITFEETEPATLSDYQHFLFLLDTLYRMILTVIKPEYLGQSWLLGQAIEVSPEDALSVIEISKLSPDKLAVEGIAVGLKAVAQVLSVGAQLTEIRLSNSKVKDAKLDLKAKELEIAEARAEAETKARTRDAHADFDLMERRLEVQKLQNIVRQEELKLQRMLREEIEKSLALLEKSCKVLPKMPPEIRRVFRYAVERAPAELYTAPYEILAFQESVPETPLPSHQPADASRPDHQSRG